MYVNYMKLVGTGYPDGYITKAFKTPYAGQPPLTGSECEWIVPGTVDPRD